MISLFQGGLGSRKHHRKNKNGSTDPSLYLSHQNRIRNMYPPTFSSGDDIIREISESSTDETSDTPQARTPDPIASSQHSSIHSKEQYHLPGDYESHSNKSVSRSLSISSLSEENVNRQNSEIDMGMTKFSSNQRDSLSMSDISSPSEVYNGDEHGQKISSDVSDSGFQVEERFENNDQKRFSDLSNLEDRLTPQNQQILENFLIETDERASVQFSSESGIVSETTSPNQSDASHQSVDLTTSFKLDPEAIAKKVLADVASQRQALEYMQKVNFMQSQKHSFVQRQQFLQNDTMQTKMGRATILNQNGVRTQAVQSGVTNRPYDNQQTPSPKLKSNVQVQQSRVVRPRKEPPPVPVKPKLKTIQNILLSESQTESINLLRNGDVLTESCDKQTNLFPFSQPVPLRTISEQDMQNNNPHSVSETVVITNRRNSNTSNTSAVSLSSFKPPEVKSRGSPQYSRPDSTTSTSSHCSTSSSVRSVIYRPKPGQSWPPSYEQAVADLRKRELSQGIRNSRTNEAKSPAISNKANSSTKLKKSKKRVSFSDSDPSESMSSTSMEDLNSSRDSTTVNKKSAIKSTDQVNGHGLPTGHGQYGFPQSSLYSPNPGKIVANGFPPHMTNGDPVLQTNLPLKTMNQGRNKQTFGKTQVFQASKC